MADIGRKDGVKRDFLEGKIFCVQRYLKKGKCKNLRCMWDGISSNIRKCAFRGPTTLIFKQTMAKPLDVL